MGNFIITGPGIRRDRRRELAIVFYFIFGFILIRIWILLIETNNIIVESIGGAITLVLFIGLYIRYRMVRAQQLEEEERRRNRIAGNPSDLALLRSLFITPLRGLSPEVISSLYCFPYSESVVVVDTIGEGAVNEPAEGMPPNASQQLNNVVVDIESQRSNSSERGVPSTSCSVCLAEYANNDEIMMLPCRHTYHKTCVTEWLQRHTQCPLCKQDVLELLEQQLFVHHQLERLREMSREGEEGLVEVGWDGGGGGGLADSAEILAAAADGDGDGDGDSAAPAEQVTYPYVHATAVVVASSPVAGSPPLTLRSSGSPTINPRENRNPLQPSPTSDTHRPDDLHRTNRI